MNLLKGPWKIKGYGGQHDETGAYIVDSEGNHAASSAHLRCNTHEVWREYQAKAYVIAAAPQMYEALIDAQRALYWAKEKLGSLGMFEIGLGHVEEAIKIAEKGSSK